MLILVLIPEMDFFRFCPSCGRRFHVKLVGKKLTHLDRTSVRTETVVSPRRPGRNTASTSLVEGVPIVVDIEEFQYAHRCNHCGHEWTEKHVEEHREK